MTKRKKVGSRETGLEMGLIIGKHFLHTEHLHYGYWTDDLSPDLLNLPQAQQRHSEFLVSHVPDRVKTILDVGCGGGQLALKLIDMGYQVDGVSPSPVLTKNAHKLLGDRAHVFESRIEELETDNRYDVVLFSESFQYANLEAALQKSFRLLNDGGYLLICDFFKTDTEEKSIIGGGHSLSSFYDQISRYPLEPVQNIDITEQTAPTLDVANDFLMNVGQPVWDLAVRYLNDNYRLVSKFLQWKYSDKIEKINRKYFSGARDAETFAKFKTYRLLLYQKVAT